MNKTEPKMVHRRYQDYGEWRIGTWWTKSMGQNGVMPLDSDNLKPVPLPEGLECTLATMIRHLPGKSAAEKA